MRHRNLTVYFVFRLFFGKLWTLKEHVKGECPAAETSTKTQHRLVLLVTSVLVLVDAGFCSRVWPQLNNSSQKEQMHWMKLSILWHPALTYSDNVKTETEMIKEAINRNHIDTQRPPRITQTFSWRIKGVRSDKFRSNTSANQITHTHTTNMDPIFISVF